MRRWDEDKGTFKNMLIRSVNMHLKDYRKHLTSNKQAVLAESLSLHLPLNFRDNEGYLIDTVPSTSNVEEEIEVDLVDSLISSYALDKGEAEALVVYALIFISDKRIQTRAFCEALGIDEYTASARVKVARIKKGFRGYCDEKNILDVNKNE